MLFLDTGLPDMPFSPNEGADPEQLRAWMQTQRDDGKRVFAIPHNSNESTGLLFAEASLTGKPYDAAYAETHASMEPLIEMQQIKGKSEVVPYFWPNDEFADFESAASMQEFNGRTFLKENYVRYRLTRGLKYNADLGTNPFKYRFVGGTDSHNGAPSNVAAISLTARAGIGLRRTKLLLPSASHLTWQDREIRPDAALRGRLRGLANERRRFACGRLFVLLRQDGEPSGINRIYLLCSKEGLTVRKRKARSKALGTKAPILVEARANARWSLDFVHDQFACGRQFRVLNVVDNVTRECLAAIPDMSTTGRRVARGLTALNDAAASPE